MFFIKNNSNIFFAVSLALLLLYHIISPHQLILPIITLLFSTFTALVTLYGFLREKNNRKKYIYFFLKCIIVAMLSIYPILTKIFFVQINSRIFDCVSSLVTVLTLFVLIKQNNKS